MPFPDNCIRGIFNSNCLLEGSNIATLTLYEFHRNPNRAGGWNEASINWMDDEQAIDFTLKQTNDEGELKFEVGIAILPRIELDKLRKVHTNFFDYERQRIQDSDYHGNLLLRDETSKTRKTLIRAALAIHSENRPREGYQSS